MFITIRYTKFSKFTTMKKFLLFAAIIFSFAIFTQPAQAFEVMVDNSINLSKEEIADGNIYASCGDMIIDGVVNGDIIAVCKNIVINGTINGDLIAFSQDITINGEIKGSARMAGTKITINGLINHNVNAFGTEIDLTPNSVISWDALVAGVNGKFNGTVAGNLHGSISSANIAGKIGKNINLTIDNNQTGNLLLTRDAVVGGALTYTANKEAVIESPSSVVGEITKKTNKDKSSDLINILASIFYKLSALILVGLVIISLKKKVAYDVSQKLSTKNWQSSLVGFMALILSPIIILFFTFTLIGIPLAILLLATYIILLFLGVIFASFWLGDLLLKIITKKKTNAFASLIIGLTVFVLLMSLPVIGWALALIITFNGLGALLLTIKSSLYDQSGNI